MKIKAITKRPGGKPVSTWIEDNLKNLQNAVGGYIETFTITTDRGRIVVICDEEGRMKDKERNCTLFGNTFVGDIVIVGADPVTGNFKDLPFDYQELKKLLPGLWEE